MQVQHMFYQGFSIMAIFTGLFFLAFFATLFIIVFKSVTTWSHNNHSPLLTVDVTVVAKRDHMDVRGGHMGSDAHMHSSHSYHQYYVTFQVESGDRLELEVPGNEFGYIIEGDKGKLSFKGTRFVGFERV